MKKNLILIGICFILIIYLIFSNITGFAIPCIFNYLTGFLCPGCGSTRMLKALLSGDIIKAFYYNQFLFLSLPIFLVLLINVFYSNIKNIKPWIFKIPNYIYIIYAALAIIFGIVRNII